MKKMALLLLCSVIGAFASRVPDGIYMKAAINELEYNYFLEENNAAEKRRLYIPMRIRLVGTNESFETNSYFYFELDPIVIGVTDKNYDQTHEMMKGCLSVMSVKHITSVDILKEYARKQFNAEIENIAGCEHILNNAKELVGGHEEWLELDRLTTVAPQEGVDTDKMVHFYQKALIKIALRKAGPLFPHAKVARVYLKETEQDQINAYIECGFTKSEHQYVANNDLIVYEKQIN